MISKKVSKGKKEKENGSAIDKRNRIGYSPWLEFLRESLIL